MLPDRILRRIEFTDDCWLWIGATFRGGYGRTSWESRHCVAHRLVRFLLVGDVEPWTTDRKADTLDHLCRVRNCVNPDHLEPVTLRENILRGNTVSARHAGKTHCDNGHEFSDANTRVRVRRGRTVRECRACDAMRHRADYRSQP